jgi:hypothetical protein
MRRADGRTEIRGVLQELGRHREGGGAEAVYALGVVVEGERGEIGVGGAGDCHDRESLLCPDLECERLSVVRHAQLRRVGQGADNCGDEEKGAVGGGVRVGADGGRGGDDGPQVLRAGRDGHEDRIAIARAGLGELVGAAPELGLEERPQLPVALARGAWPAGVRERLGEGVHGKAT